MENVELNIEQILQSDRAWEYVLLDIVKSEDLDPWDIDITKLTQSYMKRIHKMKELDLRVPARLLLAAAILLKMQSDQLLLTEEGEDVFDDTFDPEEGLFDEPEDQGEEEEDLPMLDLRIRRKPIRKVTLDDLIIKLRKSFEPKERRERAQPFVLELSEVDITKQIEELHKKIIKTNIHRIPFKDLAQSKDRAVIIETFIPLLHLANEHKIDLEQENFFSEIFVLPKAEETT